MIQAIGGHNSGLELKPSHSFLSRCGPSASSHFACRTVSSLWEGFCAVGIRVEWWLVTIDLNSKLGYNAHVISSRTYYLCACPLLAVEHLTLPLQRIRSFCCSSDVSCKHTGQDGEGTSRGCRGQVGVLFLKRRGAAHFGKVDFCAGVHLHIPYRRCFFVPEIARMCFALGNRSHYVERREDCKAVVCPTNAQCSGEAAATEGLQMGSQSDDRLPSADTRCPSVDLENIISPWIIPFASIVSFPPPCSEPSEF